MELLSYLPKKEQISGKEQHLNMFLLSCNSCIEVLKNFPAHTSLIGNQTSFLPNSQILVFNSWNLLKIRQEKWRVKVIMIKLKTSCNAIAAANVTNRWHLLSGSFIKLHDPCFQFLEFTWNSSKNWRVKVIMIKL